MVRKLKGIIKLLNKPILSTMMLESGIRIIWCDHTINNIIDRTKDYSYGICDVIKE